MVGLADPPPPGAPSWVFLGVAYLFALVAGVLLAVYGVVSVPVGLRFSGLFVSLGVLVAGVGNTGVSLLTRWLTGTRLGPVIVLVGWVPVALALGSARPEGDLMLRATLSGYLFLGVGLLAPIVVAVVGPARRGLTAFTLPPPGGGRRGPGTR
ncbi:DUF6113 family protein [Frankia nepalensis]|uniref:DUF6113 family protein n=1 Tax=Frankia nepalensis TaxID=1836974 RepID=UPI00288A2311|nr:DUF6113 family protein [Frankia nepalensis]